MLYIFSKDEKLVAILKPDFGRTTIKTGVSQAFLHTEYPAAFDRAEVEGCPYFDAVHTEKLTGENIFTFSVPANHPDSQYVTEGNLVAFKDLDNNWQLFEIKRVNDIHGDGLTRTAFCEHAFYELIDDFIEDKRPYNVSAAYALEQALAGTRWQVGHVDDLGLNSVNFYYESVLSALQKIANTWGGELQFRIIVAGNVISARYVDLLARRGAETGKQFVYSKDIKSIEREVDLTQVVTALYGRGKGEQIEEGYGRRITFEDVEWSVTNGDPADKPLGQKWVGDPEALARWGRPGGRHRFGVFEDSEEEDPAVLLQKTWEELQRRKNPRITYKLDVADLERLTGYEHEKVRLGDTVRVIDRAFSPELLVEARVIEIQRDLLQPENTKITLGNFAPSIVDETIKQEQIRQTVSDRQGVWDRANQFNPDGTLDTEWLNGIIDTLRNEVRAGRGTVTVTDNNGILIVDDPDNPTKALRLLGGMFAIANSKDPVTGEWNWQTFGTGEGFTANLITSGYISAERIAADSITADKLNVTSLSAISANLGTVTAGTIKGVTIEGSTLQGVTLRASGDAWIGRDIVLYQDTGGVGGGIYFGTSDPAGFVPCIYVETVSGTQYNLRIDVPMGLLDIGSTLRLNDTLDLNGALDVAGDVYVNGVVSVDNIKGYTNSEVIRLGTTGPSVDMSGGNARWKRSNLDYIFQSDTSFNVYFGGSVLFRVTSSGNADVFGNTICLRNARTPASATATGNAGDICWDSNYIYVCVATNSWKRVALSSW